MPLYEYLCETCGARFEQAHPFAQAGEAMCPNGHRRARRLISAPAVVFRGSGWYVTDSRPRKTPDDAG